MKPAMTEIEKKRKEKKNTLVGISNSIDIAEEKTNELDDIAIKNYPR